MISNLVGLLITPEQQWHSVREESRQGYTGLLHTLLLAAVPAVAGYIGAVHIGWSIGAAPTQYLTGDSALLIFIPCYFAQIIIILALSRAIHWMAQTYDSNPAKSQSMAIAAYSATPLFLAGLAGLYPSLWLFMLVGLLAICHSIYLLYTGVPIVMNITKEQGFVFSSAILTVGLVMMVGLIVVTVISWSFGLTPVFT